MKPSRPKTSVYRKGGYGESDYNSEDRPSFSAVCDSCGRDCDLPFKPTGDKPVYCRDCFKKQDSGYSNRGSNDRGGKRPYSNSNDSNAKTESRLRRIEEKLDTLLEMMQS